MLSERAYNHLKSLAEEVSAREGCRLYDIEFLGGSQSRVLRVYIDEPQKGVDIGQCANVSRGLSLLLDVEDIVPGGHYELEVSSPGLERLLRLPWHFRAVVDQKIKVKLKDPIVPKGTVGEFKRKVKQLSGVLIAADDQNITLSAEGKEWDIALDQIHRANLVHEFKDNSLRKKRSK